jgi:hypothetical protein
MHARSLALDTLKLGDGWPLAVFCSSYGGHDWDRNRSLAIDMIDACGAGVQMGTKQ